MQAHEIISFVVENNDDNISRGLYRPSGHQERDFIKSKCEQMLYQALCAAKCSIHFPRIHVENRVAFDDYAVRITVSKETIRFLREFHLW